MALYWRREGGVWQGWRLREAEGGVGGNGEERCCHTDPGNGEGGDEAGQGELDILSSESLPNVIRSRIIKPPPVLRHLLIFPRPAPRCSLCA